MLFILFFPLTIWYLMFHLIFDWIQQSLFEFQMYHSHCVEEERGGYKSMNSVTRSLFGETQLELIRDFKKDPHLL